MLIIYILLFIVLLLNFIFTKLYKKLKVPHQIVPIILGIIAGYFLRSHTAWSEIDASLSFILELAVIFMLFLAGLEIRIPKSMKTLEVEFLSAIEIWILYSIVYYFLFKNIWLSLFLSTISFMTSELLVAEILEEKGLLDKKIGVSLMEYSLINTILGVLIANILFYFFEYGTSVGVFLQFALQLILIVSFALFARVFLVSVYSYILQSSTTPEETFMATMILVLAIIILSEVSMIGTAAGAFIAGILTQMVEKRLGKKGVQQERDVHHVLKEITEGFLFPIGMFAIGTHIHFSILEEEIGILLLLSIVFIPLYIFRRNFKRSWKAFYILSHQRAGFDIILSYLAYSIGLISDSIYGAWVLVSLLTTLASSPLLERILTFKPSQD